MIDQACGTGGMLSTAYSYLKHYNPTADVRLFGQEFMGQSYAVGLAEMLIKGQDSTNFRHADTFKKDCFEDTKMRFVIENPPFGTPWDGKDAKLGQPEAVRKEYEKHPNGRWGAGLPKGDDSQLLFLQSAINKLDDNGRCAIIENSSPLFSGNTSSGESQIRKYLLDNDLIEAIIQLPTDLFYNTGITTYIWILSKTKREERKDKIQLIDASSIYHKLRKPLGNKKNEFLPEDRAKITKLYADFKENEFCQIYDYKAFLYREYTVMQPLQRSYAITKERIENMITSGALSSLYDESKVYELENTTEELTNKDKNKLNNYIKNKPIYDNIIKTLTYNISNKVYLKQKEFEPVIIKILGNITDKKIIEKVINGLSAMDKNAEIQRDKKGNVIYDKETKDIEIVPYNTDIEEYMKKEVLPHVPDAKAFFEEDLTKNKPIIKTGAEIPFTRYFYKYVELEKSEDILKRLRKNETDIAESLKNLFDENK